MDGSNRPVSPPVRSITRDLKRVAPRSVEGFFFVRVVVRQKRVISSMPKHGGGVCSRSPSTS